MLVQKLSTDDLQSERTAFDGTMVYAQNKVSEGFLKAATWVLFQGRLILGFTLIWILVIPSSA